MVDVCGVLIPNSNVGNTTTILLVYMITDVCGVLIPNSELF